MPAPATARTEAELIEVFSSFQGEGTLVGVRQVFVRFAFCNLDCGYCDTPFAPTSECRIEDAPGSENFRSLPNPVALETLYNVLHFWEREAPGLHHSISLTGGEPLVQAEVLREWLPALRRVLPLHLETNGTLPEALAPLLTALDYISMDLKLPSQTGCAPLWEAHREFLRLGRERICQVKAVIGEETPLEEIEQAARLLHETAPEVPLILQPVTRNGRPDISPPALFALQTRAARIHPPVRIIPQIHKFLGVF